MAAARGSGVARGWKMMSGIRRIALVAAAGLWMAAPGVVLAQAVTEDQVIAALEEQGFTVIESGTTFLGRIRITAEGPEGTREVVLNPRNGKVLRDIIIDDATVSPPPPILAPVILPPATLPPEEATAAAPEAAREVAGPPVHAVPEATEAGRSSAAPSSVPLTVPDGTAERSGD